MKMFCPQCGTPLPDDAKFCGNCGTPTNQQAINNTEATHQRSAIDISTVIGKNSAYYLKEFSKIETGEKTSFNLAAWFFNIIFCFYRKCGWYLFKKYFFLPYAIVIISIILSFISINTSSLILTTIGGGLSFAGSIWYFINCIRLGINFNLYYHQHCQTILTANDTKRYGTSIKNALIIFVISYTIPMLCYAFTLFPPIYSDYNNLANDNDISYDEDASEYGIIECDDGTIAAYTEKGYFSYASWEDYDNGNFFYGEYNDGSIIVNTEDGLKYYDNYDDYYNNFIANYSDSITGYYLANSEDVSIYISATSSSDYFLTYSASGVTLSDIPLAYIQHDDTNGKSLMFYIDDYYPEYSGYVEIIYSSNSTFPYSYSSVVYGSKDLEDTGGYYSTLSKE